MPTEVRQQFTRRPRPVGGTVLWVTISLFPIFTLQFLIASAFSSGDSHRSLARSGAGLREPPETGPGWRSREYRNAMLMDNRRGRDVRRTHSNRGRGRSLNIDSGTGNGNYLLNVPLLELPGRGIPLSLSLFYNSLLWQQTNSKNFVFDHDHDWPAPGWSLGFGQISSLVRLRSSSRTPTRHAICALAPHNSMLLKAFGLSTARPTTELCWIATLRTSSTRSRINSWSLGASLTQTVRPRTMVRLTQAAALCFPRGLQTQMELQSAGTATLGGIGASLAEDAVILSPPILAAEVYAGSIAGQAYILSQGDLKPNIERALAREPGSYGGYAGAASGFSLIDQGPRFADAAITMGQGGTSAEIVVKYSDGSTSTYSVTPNETGVTITDVTVVPIAGGGIKIVVKTESEQ
jgi:hypothetical protein